MLCLVRRAMAVEDAGTRRIAVKESEVSRQAAALGRAASERKSGARLNHPFRDRLEACRDSSGWHQGDLAVQVAGQLVDVHVDAFGLQLVQHHASIRLEAEDETSRRELFLYIEVAVEGVELGRLGLPVGSQDLVALALVADESRADILAATAGVDAEEPTVQVLDGEADGRLFSAREGVRITRTASRRTSSRLIRSY